MDSITHIVLGAVQGELIAGKKLGKKAMLWGAAANSLPDIDVALSPFLTPEDNLLAHRGFTHSILFAVLISYLLGYLFYKRFNSGHLSLGRWVLLFGAGMFTHIFMDALTNYGTGWFEPFSHYRVAFNTIFVLDPFYTIPLIIATIALLILRKDSRRRTTWANAGLVLSCLYLLFNFYNKYAVDKVVRENLAQQHIPQTDYFTTPTPLNNFLWYIVVKGDKQFNLGYYSIFDSKPEIQFTRINQNDSLLKGHRSDKAIQKLKRFSQGYYCVTPDDSGDVIFNDIRFGTGAGWKNPAAGFVFSYQLRHGASNTLVVQRGRFRGFSRSALSDLVLRIKGN